VGFSVDKVKRYYDIKGATYDEYAKQLWSKLYDEVTWKITEPYIPKDTSAQVFDAVGGTGKWSIPIAGCGPSCFGRPFGGDAENC
jgi:hypothetical protein